MSRLSFNTVLLTVGLPAVVLAQNIVHMDPYDIKYEPGVVLVKFEENVEIPVGAEGRLGKLSNTALRETLSKYGVESAEVLFPNAKRGEALKKVRTFEGSELEVGSLYNIFRLKFDKAYDAKAVSEDLGKQAGILYAEPDYYVYALDGKEGTLPDVQSSSSNGLNKNANTVPNDPLYTEQWYLKSFPGVNAEVAWDVTTGDTTQIIGIIDTGVDWDHPDLDDNIWRNWDEIPENGIDDDHNGFVDDVRGWDFVNDDNDPTDDNSHGTHVAGIAAAEGNNGIGICGVAWKAKIMPVKMLQSSGSGSFSDLALAITYAAQNGATVINMSLGSYGESLTFKTALENAYNKSVLVAAAGNDGFKVDLPYPPWPPYAPIYPACYGFVIGVQASDQSGTRATFSNYDPTGPTVDGNGLGLNYEMQAPGVDIFSSFPNGNYRSLLGTSMACPIVSGAVALIKQNEPNISTEELFARLIQGAHNGILDIRQAVDQVLIPELQYLTYALVDTLTGDDRDGIADVGETIEICCKVKNAGGLADSVWSKIDFGEFEDHSVATILKNTSYIGDISTYGILTGEHDPFRIMINPSVANNREIVFNITIGANNYNTFSLTLSIRVMNGCEVGGVLTSDTYWTNDKSYILTDNLRISRNVILNIQPGTTIQINPGKCLDVRGSLIAKGKKDSIIVLKNNAYGFGGNIISSGNISSRVELEYLISEYNNGLIINGDGLINVKNCIFRNCGSNDLGDLITYGGFTSAEVHMNCNTFCMNETNINTVHFVVYGNKNEFNYNNIIKNIVNKGGYWTGASGLELCVGNWGQMTHKGNNIFGNISDLSGENLFLYGSEDYCNISNNYWGVLDDEIIKSGIFDFSRNPSSPSAIFTPFLSQPSDSAHGLVWKVELNGNNPQDGNLSPTGIETVKFDVYFNRAMETSITPFVTFGVRDPFTQHMVIDNASWSSDSTVWTAYYTFGLETGDGINTIRIANARDNEHFEIPIEDKRFKFTIQAAGAMSNEFIASAAVGKVNLEWPNAESPDVIGYNLYRCYNQTDTTFSDTTRINASLVTDTTYSDFAVIPDTTYHYMYKVLGTDMVESDFSKSVAATPVKASSGDANGDLTVNVQDIVTIIGYILEQNPQPFLLEAADMNHDGAVNVLDVVAAVKKILSLPKAMLASRNEIESNNALLALYKDKIRLTGAGVAGLQFSIIGKEAAKLVMKPGPALEGFEIAKAEKDGEVLVVVYSLGRRTIPSGENSLFSFEGGGELKIESALACSQSGNMVTLLVENKGKVEIPDRYVLNQNYPNPFNPETVIRYGLPKAGDVTLTVFNALGQRVRVFEEGKREAGYHDVVWDGKDVNGVLLPSGVYVYRIEAGQFKKSVKMVLLR
jgi:subtilisin family serine protease